MHQRELETLICMVLWTKSLTMIPSLQPYHVIAWKATQGLRIRFTFPPIPLMVKALGAVSHKCSSLTAAWISPVKLVHLN